ncbi:17-beta-hydroxysteroid dehydrogenase-like protein [Maudiozyma humilis]|uniref:17-beta-hydroxysteroid dehydrogenase-like protein n=1 Tax=Maudiozyma humilis TaxID=51915 RepID=A0AAV5RUZ0_MAUHU|nr:17-beta-hydroxysteroid dehydrogenase-like protein [Kazachstania humilis]
MTFFRAIKNKFEHNQTPNFDSTEEVTINMDKRAIYRNRTNYGVNIGSLFVLESWIYDDIFNEVGGGNTELDAVSNCQAKLNTQETANKLRQHYESYLDKIDWNFLRDRANITSIRVPIGYWHVNNGGFLQGLPFEHLAGVYQNARPWDYLKQLINVAGQNNISVLIDLHGLPGGANDQAHSGAINNPPKFFKTPAYVNKVCDEILPFITRDICSPFENIAGLQIVNETYFDNNANDIKAYYSRAISSISNIDNTLAVVISDGWWSEQWSNWLAENKLESNAVIDTHVYRCFSNEDKGKDAGTIINQLPGSVNLPKDKADFTVGEFSCVLDEETWKRTQGDRNVHISNFGVMQTTIFPKVASFGWYFWTLQFKYGDGGEWGFVPMVSKNNLILRSRNVVPIDQNRVNQIINDHIEYWKGKGNKFEHWRFEDAIRQAVNDIASFNQFNNSRLGRWRSWTLRRRAEYIKAKGDSEFMWEWDQGYQKGLDEFNH